jgi:hypothetical protein
MNPSTPVRYVTMAYGGAPQVYRQSVMLLLSLVAYAPEPYELLVATDRPDCYVWFGTRVEIEFLDSGRLAAWRGPEPFSMRQKLELARAAADPRSSRAAHIVLLDADVLAARPLDRFVAGLHAGELFMHRREYVLARSARRGNRQLWTALQRFDRSRRPEPAVFSLNSAMWNSGVLATGVADRNLLDEALRLYDQLGAAGVRHFATEQLVEGVVLGRSGRLRPSDEWFVHYWGNKPGYDAEISRHLADAFIEGLTVKEAAARYREKPIELPPEVRPTTREKAARWLTRRRRK